MWVVVLSTLPSVVVIKTFVAKMLTTWQMIPARCVSIFSTPGKRQWQSGPFKTICIWSKRMIESDLIFFITLRKRSTFQMHLQNKLGMWLSIRPSRTFCTSSQTGRLPPLCLWLFFCSTRESVEETITELHSTLLAEHFKLEMHRTHTLHRYLRPCSADQVCHSYSYIRLLTQFIGTQQFLASSYLL